MGARFVTEYVYLIDKENNAYFVQNYYGADLCGSYRSDVYLANKRYCVHDLLLTDEVETEGEYLPFTREKEWREFWTAGPSVNVSTILSEAGLSDIAAAKLVFIRMDYSSRSILDYSGFVSSAQGVQEFDSDFWDRAFAFSSGKTTSIVERQDIMVQWMIEQL